MVFLLVMYGCESWTIKKAEHWRIDAFELVLKKTLQNPLDCKEIQQVHPRGNQSWLFFVRTDAQAESPILCPPDAKNWLLWKDPDAGKDWRQEEKGTTEDEMVGWHHWLEGHEFEQALREAWCAAVHGSQRVSHDWGTELNWTELKERGKDKREGGRRKGKLDTPLPSASPLHSTVLSLKREKPVTFLAQWLGYCSPLKQENFFPPSLS